MRVGRGWHTCQLKANDLWKVRFDATGWFLAQCLAQNLSSLEEFRHYSDSKGGGEIFPISSLTDVMPLFCTSPSNSAVFLTEILIQIGSLWLSLNPGVWAEWHRLARSAFPFLGVSVLWALGRDVSFLWVLVALNCKPYTKSCLSTRLRNCNVALLTRLNLYVIG